MTRSAPKPPFRSGLDAPRTAPPGLENLARQLARRWPSAKVLSVTWLGPSGNAQQGEEALAAFARALVPTFATAPVIRTSDHRTDRFVAR